MLRPRKALGTPADIEESARRGVSLPAQAEGGGPAPADRPEPAPCSKDVRGLALGSRSRRAA